MIQRIRELLRADQFKPFAIRSDDGRQFFVPTFEHAHVRPDDTRIYIFLDEGEDVAITALHLTAVIEGINL